MNVKLALLSWYKKMKCLRTTALNSEHLMFTAATAIFNKINAVYREVKGNSGVCPL